MLAVARGFRGQRGTQRLGSDDERITIYNASRVQKSRSNNQKRYNIKIRLRLPNMKLNHNAILAGVFAACASMFSKLALEDSAKTLAWSLDGQLQVDALQQVLFSNCSIIMNIIIYSLGDPRHAGSVHFIDDIEQCSDVGTFHQVIAWKLYYCRSNGY